MPNLPNTQAEYDGKPKYKRQADRDRLTAAERGYDARWQKIRAAYLARHPLCERCKNDGKTTAAYLVHHKDRNSRNNRSDNLEALCSICHDNEHINERFTKRNDFNR